MRPISPRPDRRFRRPPLVVVPLVLVVIAAAVVIVVGVSPVDVRLWAPSFVVALIILLVGTPIVARLEDIGRQKPKLSVVAQQADAAGFVAAPAPRPWPVDSDRVVANELAAAKKMLAVRADSIAMSVLIGGLGGPFAVRPSDRDYALAREAFEQELQDFEVAFRGWLADYSRAAATRGRTFDLTLRIENSPTGAYAEAVVVVVDLPATVSVAEGWPTVPLPPARPEYHPPRMRSIGDSVIDRPIVRCPSRVDLWVPPRQRTWEASDDGRQARAWVGELHTGGSAVVDEPLVLLADSSGEHEIRWTANAKCGRSVHGKLTLVIPPEPSRLAIGRLDGITSYPDVPIVNGDAEVVHAVRTTDPPRRPEADSEAGDKWGRIRHAHALIGWNALGLDPAADESRLVQDARQPAEREPAQASLARGTSRAGTSSVI